MRYALAVLRHKYFVLIAGLRLGGIPLWRLITHDWSKFHPREFATYRKRFGSKLIISRNEWRMAFLHHYSTNPHHWEHWVYWDGNPLPMPETYVREMIADWMGASKSYAGHWDFMPWVRENIPHMKLHTTTKNRIKEVLRELGEEL